MEQRRLRVGDNIDDYCPRERRLTTHAIVAMVGDAVKQTRCTTCDAEHVYKGAKVPQRRKTEHETGVLVAAEGRRLGTLAAGAPPAEPAQAGPTGPAAESRQGDAPEQQPATDPPARVPDDDGPIHRRLIRAVLPRTEGQTPVRQMPEFTMRQPGVRHPDLINGNGRRGPENGNQASTRPFKGGHDRPFHRHGKSGRTGSAHHGSPQGHGQRHGRHAGRGKKRPR